MAQIFFGISYRLQSGIGDFDWRGFLSRDDLRESGLGCHRWRNKWALQLQATFATREEMFR